MMGGLSILAVGLVIGVAIAWVLPGLPRPLPSVAARATPREEKPAGAPDPGAGPNNDQPSLAKLDADDAARVREPRSQNSFWGRIAMMSWANFFESKGFGACFGGLVSVLTFQMAGANARSIFALTLLIVVGYWLAFDKSR